MMTSKSRRSGLLALLVASVALAGCGGDGDGGTTPTTGTTGTTTPTTSPPPEPIPPGIAYNQEATFDAQNPATLAKMSITTNWTKLAFTYWLNKTQQCYVITSDPPMGTTAGPAPKVTITSPTQKKVEFTLPSGPGACDQNAAGVVQHPTSYTDAANEMGDWTFVINGRGTGLKLRVWVGGR